MDVVTSSDRPDLEDEARAGFRVKWPEFIFHDPTSRVYIDRVEKYFPSYDVLLLDEDRVIAGGWGVPMQWDGSPENLPGGYDGALARSVEGHEADLAPTTLCLMAVAVVNNETRRGLAGMALSALRTRAADAGLDHVLAPVRPSLKSRYPLTDMEIFAAWSREDGLSIDPWIRTHQRLGATILGPARRSMVITGSVGEWESWTEMVFPQTGHYVVPDALGLVDIDREADQGTYVEDNLWMQHA
jgi:hypothetical protein